MFWTAVSTTTSPFLDGIPEVPARKNASGPWAPGQAAAVDAIVIIVILGSPESDLKVCKAICNVMLLVGHIVNQ